MIEFQRVRFIIDTIKSDERLSLNLAELAVDEANILTHEEIQTARSLGIISTRNDQVSFVDDFHRHFFQALKCIHDFLSKESFVNPSSYTKFKKEYYEMCKSLGSDKNLLFFILREIYQIDIFYWINGPEKRDFWFIYHHIRELLPYLDITISDLNRIIPSILEQSKGDLTSGMIFKSVETLSQFQPSIGLEILEEARNDSSTLKPFVSDVLCGLSRSLGIMEALSLAYEFIASQDIELRKAGIHGVSTFSFDTDHPKLSSIESDLDTIYAETDRELFSTLAEAYGNLLYILPSAQAKIRELSKSDEPRTQYVISGVLWRKANYAENPEWYLEILMNLAKVKSEHNGIIQNLNYCLSDLLKKSPEPIKSFLEAWVVAEGRKSEDILLFEHLLSEYRSTCPEHFADLVTTWFNKSDLIFHKALEKVLLEYFDKELSLNLENLRKHEIGNLHFIIVKILGFVISIKQLKAMLYSFIEADIDDIGLSQHLVDAFTQTGLDYPSVKEFLQEKKGSASTRQLKLIDQIIKNIDNYFKPMTEITRLKELTPSEERLNEYFKQQSKQQTKAREESEKSSFLLSSLARNVSLKSGGLWFSKTDSGYSDKVPLGHFHFEAELPRRELIDPIGLARRRFTYRVLKKKK